MKITDIHAREILDSRGNPTVEVDMKIDTFLGRAAVPSGASTGVHEALELRDGDEDRYHGKGVLKAVANVNEKIAAELVGKEFETVEEVDKMMIEMDGTENKSSLGANAILAVSMAFVQAHAAAQGKQAFEYISEMYGADPVLPRPMFNIMNGGAHANWSTDIQEFMVLPLVGDTFADQLEMGSEIFHSLEKILKDKGLSVNVGNEGGFAPALSSNPEALDLIMSAIEASGFTPGEDVGLGLDIAASEFHVENEEGEEDDQYHLKTEDRILSVAEWMDEVGMWIEKYPFVSIEDPLNEDSWNGWAEFLNRYGDKLEQVVGDDFLVTNVKRIEKAIEQNSCNALLVKLNQIGSVSETVAAMKLSESAGWKNVVSHRSGETEDTFISHLVVGTGAGQLKSGAPSRSERTAKFNELLRIEEYLRA